MGNSNAANQVAQRRENRLRIALLTELPTPYRQPLFEGLVQTADADVTVFYFSASEVDRSWNVTVPRNDPHFRVLKAKSFAFMGKNPFINHYNPTLFKELDRGNFDLIIISGYAVISSQIAIAWAWLRRKPYVIRSESHLSDPRSAIRRILKSAFVRPIVSRASACLATGTLSKEYLCHYGARPERVFFFPNTPDVDWFIRRSDELRPKRVELSKKWNLPEGPTVIYVGRFIEVKALDILLKAFAETIKRAPKAQMLLVGDGPKEQSLRALATKLDIEKAVHFLGFHQRDTLVELYACADVFCLPSRHEQWGVVVNEAAACKLPLVVSNRVGSGRDLVQANRNGYVVTVDDVAELANALVAALNASSASSRMGEMSREIVLQWGYEKAFSEFSRMLRCVARDKAEKDRP